MKTRFLILALMALLVGSDQASAAFLLADDVAIPKSIPLKRDANGCYSPDPSPPNATYNPPPPWCGNGPVTVCFNPGGCYSLSIPDGTIGPLPKLGTFGDLVGHSGGSFSF